MGIAPGGAAAAEGGWGEAALSLLPPAAAAANKRLKEQELLINSQISSAAADFPQNRPVSTGLGLSLDDRRLAAASSSGDSPPLFLMLDDEIDRELQRQEVELDRFIKIKGEQLRQAILEKVQSKHLETLTSVEDRILRRLREKEVEVDSINRKNRELEEQMKQLTVEVGNWQSRAKYNENMISTLKFHLQQVVGQSRDSKEGCGDSEVDDTASCCNVKAMDLQLVCRESKESKGQVYCRVCRVKEVCMLLLPCRHLCLCKDCESKLGFCPLCHSSKVIGMEVYM
ncbi:unnamed protein product [Spirodela intermedia]|uniref:RING-type domain-containing protein n=1 Tax=Spirodela intermedia TaxID=51605 RepID=A0A7I8IPC9_SPIIN|nr:unnamed protein product [Spirodela intermedia]CAA6659424.1 unnamed protein product [Spirodela intermedia]